MFFDLKHLSQTTVSRMNRATLTRHSTTAEQDLTKNLYPSCDHSENGGPGMTLRGLCVVHRLEDRGDAKDGDLPGASTPQVLCAHCGRLKGYCSARCSSWWRRHGVGRSRWFDGKMCDSCRTWAWTCGCARERWAAKVAADEDEAAAARRALAAADQLPEAVATTPYPPPSVTLAPTPKGEAEDDRELRTPLVPLEDRGVADPVPYHEDEVARVMYGGTPGVRWTHGAAALSSASGCDHASAFQLAAVATADGLRCPVSWARVSGPRPHPERSISWPSGGGVLTVSRSGFRSYHARALVRGTGLLWDLSTADWAAKACDPEIVVATWDGLDDPPSFAVNVGGHRGQEDTAWMFFSLCPTLTPWEVPTLLRDERGEVVMTSTALATAAWFYLLEGDDTSAERVLASSTGQAEYMARWRLHQEKIPVAPFRGREAQTLAWLGPPVASLPNWARNAAARLRDLHGVSTCQATVVDHRPGGVSGFEASAAGRHVGRWVRFDFSVLFEPHVGGGVRGREHAAAFLARVLKKAISLPNSDGVCRRDVCVALPCVSSKLGVGETKRLVVEWLLTAASVQAARSPDAEGGRSGRWWLAPRDEWWARTKEFSMVFSERGQPSGRLAQSCTSELSTYRSDVAPLTPVAAVPPFTMDREVVEYAAWLLSQPPPPPEAWDYVRAQRAQLLQQTTPCPSSAVDPGEVPYALPHQSLGGAAIRGEMREVAAGILPPPRDGDPHRGSHVCAVIERGLPKIRLVQINEEVPCGPRTALSCGALRRGILGTVFVCHGSHEPWAPRPPPSTAAADTTFPSGCGVPALGDPCLAEELEECAVEDADDVFAELAVNPLSRECAVRFLGGLMFVARGRLAERSSAALAPMARDDFLRLRAVAMSCRRMGGLLSALYWRSCFWPMFASGTATRKRVASAAHVAMIEGEQYAGLDGTALMEYQRWMSRGQFLGSPTIVWPSVRTRRAELAFAGVVPPEGALAWLVKAAEDAMYVRCEVGCLACKAKTLPEDSDLAGHCVDCADRLMNAFQRGGGTIAFARAQGGGHASVVSYAAEHHIPLHTGAARDASTSIIAKAVLDPDLPAQAVWTAVFPSGQAGARDQETPGLKLAMSAIVVRTAFSALVDPDWCVPLLQPHLAATVLRSAVPGALGAFDASAATDGQSHELLRAFADIAPEWRPHNLPLSSDDLDELVQGTPSLVPDALENYINYDSIQMSVTEWASRLQPQDVSSDFQEPQAQEVMLKTSVSLLGENVELGKTILVVTGPTGCGKTRWATSLDADHRVQLCLPTRASITASAVDGQRLTSRPSSVVFYKAGLLGGSETGAAIIDGDGVWAPAERREAYAVARAYVTPYQLRHAPPDAVAVVDEAHERTWDRTLAIAACVLSGRELILVSATPPAFTLGGDLAARPLTVVTMPGPVLDVGIFPDRARAPAELLRRPGIVVFSTLRDLLADTTEGVVRLHGKLSAEETVRALAAAEGSTVFATVGVVASALTLPAAQWIEIPAKAQTRKRASFGAAQDYTTPMTASEWLQLLGRVGRMAPRAVAIVPGARQTDHHTTWASAFAASRLKSASSQEDARTAMFWDQVGVLGGPGVPDDVGILACRLMGCSEALLPFARFAYWSVAKWLGRPPQDYSRSLTGDDLAAFTAGLDPGAARREVRETRYGHGEVTTTAAAFDQHSAMPNAKEITGNAYFARGLILRLGPGFSGAWGCQPQATQQGYEPLVACLGRDLPQGPPTPLGQTYVAGRAVRMDTIPIPVGATVAEAEAAVLEGCPRRKNDAGTPMGGAANGAVLNAFISNAAKTADVAAVCAYLAHSDDPPDWARPYSARQPPVLRFVQPPSASATGGDDEADCADDLRGALAALCRLAGGARTNETKTRRTACATQAGRGSPQGTLVAGISPGSWESVVDAFGGRTSCGPFRGIAPFLERYFTFQRGRLEMLQPGSGVAMMRAVYAVGTGAVVDSSMWAYEPEFFQKITGAPTAAAQSQLVSYDPGDRRPLMGASGPPMSAPQTSVVEIRPANSALLRFSIPARAGRRPGETTGSKILRSMITNRARAREKKPVRSEDRERPCISCGEFGTECPLCQDCFCLDHYAEHVEPCEAWSADDPATVILGYGQSDDPANVVWPSVPRNVPVSSGFLRGAGQIRRPNAWLVCQDGFRFFLESIEVVDDGLPGTTAVPASVSSFGRRGGRLSLCQAGLDRPGRYTLVIHQNATASLFEADLRKVIEEAAPEDALTPELGGLWLPDRVVLPDRTRRKFRTDLGGAGAIPLEEAVSSQLRVNVADVPPTLLPYVRLLAVNEAVFAAACAVEGLRVPPLPAEDANTASDELLAWYADDQ